MIKPLKGIVRKTAAVLTAATMLCTGFCAMPADAATAFSGGRGTKTSPYVITKASQLDLVRKNLDASFKLGTDIDLSGYKNWTPIGDDYNSYKGTFDGNGHKIKNISITSCKNDEVGLFANVHSTVKNLSITGEINGTFSKGQVGAIAGFSFGKLQNCKNYCVITVGMDMDTKDAKDAKDAKDVGGIAGDVISGSVQSCYNYGNITANANEVGGVIGDAGNIPISSCFNSGSIQSTTVTDCGGISGDIVNGSIKRCCNVGSVSINSCNIVGGIVGTINNSTTSDCCNFGKITGADDSYASSTVGGIAGWNASSVKDCYSIAKLAGHIMNDMYGGIIGKAEFDANIPANCHFLAQDNLFQAGTSGLLYYEIVSPAGESSDALKSQATYANWDFNKTWIFMDGMYDGYPVLRAFCANTSFKVTKKVKKRTLAVSGAVVTINKKTYITDSKGIANVILNPSLSYSYSVSKSGYKIKTGNFKAGDSGTYIVPITLKK